MRKLVFCMALLGTFFCNLTGCGGSTEPTIVEPSTTTMAPENQSAYEEQMKKGGSATSAPGN